MKWAQQTHLVAEEGRRAQGKPLGEGQTAPPQVLDTRTPLGPSWLGAVEGTHREHLIPADLPEEGGSHLPGGVTFYLMNTKAMYFLPDSSPVTSWN